MHKKINIIFAVIVSLFYYIISYANNLENILEYQVNDATKSIIITEKTSSQTTYEFGNHVSYSLEKWSPFDYTENNNSLDIYGIWKKDCEKNYEYERPSDIKLVGAATSFVDAISEAQNINQQFVENNIEINNQQLYSTQKLLILLNEMQQRKKNLFIPELVPMLINWGKVSQVNPIAYIEEITVGTDDPNNIIFKFNLSNIVNCLHFIKPEEQQYLSDRSSSCAQGKYFSITGDCKINFKTNQKEVRLLTKSGEILLHLQTKIDDKNLLSATIDNIQNKVSFITKNESEIRYEYDKKESIAYHNRETYVLINNLNNNLNNNYSILSNVYGIYLASPKKRFTASLYSVDKCVSLPDIYSEVTSNTDTTQNTQYHKLDYLLSEIKENNYKLFIPDLIPIINKWHKTDVIHPLVIVDEKHIDHNADEAIIRFHIEKHMISTFDFDNAEDIQYLSLSEYGDNFYTFRINGVCKINLRTNKRLTYLLDNSGKIIYKSEYMASALND